MRRNRPGESRVQSARSEVGKYSTILTEQLRPQETELYSKSQDSEKSRQEQYLLVIELWSRESVHQENLEEDYHDAISHDGKNKLETELRESQSTVEMLTH